MCWCLQAPVLCHTDGGSSHLLLAMYHQPYVPIHPFNAYDTLKIVLNDLTCVRRSYKSSRGTSTASTYSTIMLPYTTHSTQPSESSIRRAIEKYQALTDGARMIKVSIAPHIVSAHTPYAPRRISFSMCMDTPTKDVVGEIHRRLPDIEHPYSITTSGPNPEVLDLDTRGRIENFVKPLEFGHVELRLRIHDPALQKPPFETSGRKKLSSRLRKVLGRSEECSRDEPAAPSAGPSHSTERRRSHCSVESPPPPYEATAPWYYLNGNSQSTSWFRSEDSD